MKISTTIAVVILFLVVASGDYDWPLRIATLVMCVLHGVWLSETARDAAPPVRAHRP